jgi:Sulfotransferase domain
MDVNSKLIDSSTQARRPVVNRRPPDFIHIGPPRTATCWLNDVLSGHVGLPHNVKDTRYFTSHYSKGFDWYLSHFRDCRPDQPIGEVCSHYFAAPGVAKRIKSHMPDCKIICTLRDPVQRLYDHYKARRSIALAADSFEESLVLRPEFIEQSSYVERLASWQAIFGKQNVLVMLFDDLCEDPQAYVRTICGFIGIPEIDLATVRIKHEHNVAAAPRSQRMARAASMAVEFLSSYRLYGVVNFWERTPLWNLCFAGGEPYGPLDPVMEEKLRVRFRPEVERLEGMLGRDLTKWKWGSAAPTERAAGATP